MLLVLRAQFGLRGARPNSAFAVEAHMVVIDDGVSRNDGAIFVHVGDVYSAEVGHRAVIGECSSAPLTTREPDAAVTEAVIHSAVEAHVRPPIASVPTVRAAHEAPISRGPQQTDSRRLHPNARNPVITGVPVSPIPRGPEVARRRKGRLFVNGQHWRSHMHRNADANSDLRVCRRNAQHRHADGCCDESSCEIFQQKTFGDLLKVVLQNVTFLLGFSSALGFIKPAPARFVLVFLASYGAMCPFLRAPMWA